MSLVAFTMRRFRFARGGRLGAWLCLPMREQSFLNLRTYVRVGGEPGITFLAEWLPGWAEVQLGPLLYGLPYRWGRTDHRHGPGPGAWQGQVTARGGGQGEFRYTVTAAGPDPAPSAAGSRDEFLLERHTCYLHGHGRDRFFRIWHPPWPQRPAVTCIEADTLLSGFAPWWGAARFLGANVSPGVRDVWMGRPQRLG